MSPAHTRRHNQRYRYYVSQHVLYGGKSTTLARVPAHEIEQAVIDALIGLLGSPHTLIDQLPDRSPRIVARLTELVEHQAVSLRSSESNDLRTLVQRVDLTDTALRLTLDLAPLFEPIGVAGAGSYAFEVPVRIAQCQHGKKLVVQGTSKINDPDRTLVNALIQAHRWDELLNEPEITTFNALAHKLGREPRYVSRIHQLVYLAPDVQLAILEGRQPPDLTLDRLTKHTRIPLNFEEQRRLYGFDLTSGTSSR